MARPFRFSVTAPPITPPISAWGQALRRVEAIGFDTVVMADHWTDGYEAEPVVTLTAAAMLTSTLGLQTGVLGNDYRHPVLTHRMAAVLDVVSGGRFVLGLGAGWLRSDYETAGLPLDPPGVRVSRLEESIAVIKGLFGDEPLTFTGEHYCIHGLDGLPKPATRPHPPLFIGGGRPRVLRIAGREADVVGIGASLRAGELGAHAVVDLAPERIEEKLAWVAEGAAAAGRRLDDIELELNHWLVRVTTTAAEGDEFLDRVAARFGISGGELGASPAVLVGPVGRIVEKLQADRERFGISAIQLDAGYHPKDLDQLAPIVAALAGT